MAWALDDAGTGFTQDPQRQPPGQLCERLLVFRVPERRHDRGIQILFRISVAKRGLKLPGPGPQASVSAAVQNTADPARPGVPAGDSVRGAGKQVRRIASEGQSADAAAILPGCGTIPVRPQHHMQDHAIVGRIKMVAVPPPAAGLGVDLDIATHRLPTLDDDRVDNIGAAVPVHAPGTDYPQRRALFGNQVGAARQLLPEPDDLVFSGDVSPPATHTASLHVTVYDCQGPRKDLRIWRRRT